MLYMTDWTIKEGACVNNFADEAAEINIEEIRLYNII